ncbi:AraC family transcriptional regulator [Silanimonas sp.]|uniref:helix-turn-helix domain-containing protein n=1 Tax=Silanimonas sp. TaxID=1929290 RepID=UPI0022CBE540|nr:AraC family transcriptional regulator [Silanimonas sp.]MCZ8167431.1 AraC family transcriptional regulator [Silanimonas sp.]
MPTHSDSPWLGAAVIAQHLAVFIGAPGDAELHAHHAHQIVFPPRDGSELIVEGATRRGDAWIVPSGVSHRVRAGTGPATFIYAEPWVYTLERLPLIDGRAPRDADAWLQWLKTEWPANPLAPALTALVADVDRLLGEPLRVGELAKRQNISISQLERRLGASIGLPAKQIAIWRRLRFAMDRVLAGATLTAAAHDAGFSDAAHFSRSLRATFGVRADRSLIPLARRHQPPAAEASRESHAGVAGASDDVGDRKGSIS